MLIFLGLVEQESVGRRMTKEGTMPKAPQLHWGLNFALLSVLWLMMGSACDPCVQLTNSICDCEPTANRKLACRQERELQRSQRDESLADTEMCAAALETCTCASIENNDWAACGMTRDNIPSTEELPGDDDS